jgi:hypothetical protein
MLAKIICFACNAISFDRAGVSFRHTDHGQILPKMKRMPFFGNNRQLSMSKKARTTPEKYTISVWPPYGFRIISVWFPYEKSMGTV